MSIMTEALPAPTRTLPTSAVGTRTSTQAAKSTPVGTESTGTPQTQDERMRALQDRLLAGELVQRDDAEAFFQHHARWKAVEADEVALRIFEDADAEAVIASRQADAAEYEARQEAARIAAEQVASVKASVVRWSRVRTLCWGGCAVGTTAAAVLAVVGL